MDRDLGTWKGYGVCLSHNPIIVTVCRLARAGLRFKRQDPMDGNPKKE
jgi:hypothetical protein